MTKQIKHRRFMRDRKFKKRGSSYAAGSKVIIIKPDAKKNKINEFYNFINAAKKEVSEYNKTRDVTYLRQAGNKLYNAHILLLELITNREIFSTYVAKSESDLLSVKDKDFKTLRRNVFTLHVYFYEGKEDEMEALELIDESISLLILLKNKYRR